MTRIEHEFFIVEWDDNKNLKNQAKHHVSFEVAELIFWDENCLTETDFIKDGEQRWRSIGNAGNNVVLFVGHLYFDDEEGKEVFRIITARPATSFERKEYYGTR